MSMITGEIFRQYFPSDPQLFLIDFIRSEHESIIISIPINEDDVFVTHINKETAKRLLDEITREHETNSLH